MSSNSSSSRWSKEHGYGFGMHHRRNPKRLYRSWWRARLTAARMNRKYHDTLHVYSCYWGMNYRDGETAEKHYHLGHPKADDMWGY